jgi:hypothetical protein
VSRFSEYARQFTWNRLPPFGPRPEARQHLVQGGEGDGLDQVLVEAGSLGGLPIVGLAVYVRQRRAHPRRDVADREGTSGYGRMISMPSIVALSVTVVKVMTICPEAFAVVVNSRTTAL